MDKICIVCHLLSKKRGHIHTYVYECVCLYLYTFTPIWTYTYQFILRNNGRINHEINSPKWLHYFQCHYSVREFHLLHILPWSLVLLVFLILTVLVSMKCYIIVILIYIKSCWALLHIPICHSYIFFVKYLFTLLPIERGLLVYLFLICRNLYICILVSSYTIWK